MTMTENHYIEVRNLVKTYEAGQMKVNAVDHVNFYVDQGNLSVLWELPAQAKPQF